MLDIDDFDFDRTAQAVYVMNPSSRDLYETWEDLRSFMISMAYTYYTKTQSFSTGGFQLTFFTNVSGGTTCRASVSAYAASEFVNKIKGLIGA